MPSVRHYLDNGGFDWVLYADVDIMITNPWVPLEALVSGIGPEHHLVSVTECSWASKHTEAAISASIRAGFFMVRDKLYLSAVVAVHS